jgi:hypothetical protein
MIIGHGIASRIVGVISATVIFIAEPCTEIILFNFKSACMPKQNTFALRRAPGKITAITSPKTIEELELETSRSRSTIWEILLYFRAFQTHDKPEFD